MPRKRKIITEVDKDKEAEPVQPTVTKINPVAIIIQNAQTNETLHTKYIKELQHLYTRVSINKNLIIFRWWLKLCLQI